MMPIANGLPTPDWPAVGAIYAFDGEDFGAEICTAALVAPHGVLTAAHCADTLEGWVALGYRAYFLVGPDIDGFEQFAEVERLVPHPDWDFDVSLAWDVGVGRLDATLDGVDPLPIGAEPVDDGWIGQDVEVVGWGSTDTDGNGWGTKRTTRAVVQSWDDVNVVIDTSGASTAICPGDSGSPMFRAQADGTLAIDGVVSWGQSLDGGVCGPISGMQRVDTALAWITETLAGFEPEPATEPEPAPAEVAAEEPAGCGCRAPAAGSPWAGSPWAGMLAFAAWFWGVSSRHGARSPESRADP